MQVPPFSLSQQIDDLGVDLEEAVLGVLHSGQYIGGPQIKRFEESFAASVGCDHTVGCNSGTDALILALRALGIGAGDEVITCSFSFFATAEAISAVGATPVFVDVDPATYLIDFDQIEAAITPATKALMPVHLFGRAVNMSRLMAIAERHQLKVVEDCAQATGARWNGQPVGSFGDVGCFSFFPTKNLGAAGDGGAATTSNSELAQTMRELAVHGMPERYLHTSLGYNSRLDAIQAAVLNVKLPSWSAGSANGQPLPRVTWKPWVISTDSPFQQPTTATAGTSSWCALAAAPRANRSATPAAIPPQRVHAMGSQRAAAGTGSSRPCKSVV